MGTRARLIDALGAVSLAGWLWLAAASRGPQPVPVAGLFSAVAVGWVALLLAWRLAPGEDPGRLRRSIWTWALLARAAGLAAEPVREDDHHRYLWDGWVFAERGNPYGVAPSAWFEDAAVPEPMQRVLDRVNYPDVPTIYGPVLEWAFLLGRRIAPGELWPWKAMVVGADLATLGLLLSMVGPVAGLLYAWCPLVIHEGAFNAHPEPVGVFALTAAIWLARRDRVRWAALAMTAAAGVKITGGLLAPLVLRRGDAKTWLAAALGAAVLWVPLARNGLPGEAPGLMAFTETWEFNSTLFAVASQAVGRRGAAVAGFAAVVAVYALVRRRGGVVRGDYLYGALFLVAPVVNPWYLLWMAPFVAMRPTGCGLAAMAAVTLSYAHGPEFGADLGAYGHPDWVRPLEFGLVAAAGVIPMLRRWTPSFRTGAVPAH